MTSRSVRRAASLALAIALAVTAIGIAGTPAHARPATPAAGPVRGPLPVNDPAVTEDLAWHLEATRAREAWRSSLGAGVTVAVIDSGVDTGHPDLHGQIAGTVACLATGGDADRCHGDAQDRNGHGTHVAGLIAARGNDHLGVVGVAPRARLLAIRALESTCGDGCPPTGDTADLAAGVRWALRRHADVINLSVAGSKRLGPQLAAAIDEAWDAGAVVVLAGGRRQDGAVFLDARAAIVVTATDREGDLAPYAPVVDMAPLGIAAPGGLVGDTPESCHVGGTPIGIVSTLARDAGDGSGYGCLAGTSMAAAQVSGGVALLLSMGYARDDAVDRLLGSARRGTGMGAGAMDLAAAVRGPYPSGVGRRHDPFLLDDATPTASTSTAGPFGVGPTSDDGPRVPTWLVVVAGGLVAGVLADLSIRRGDRRRAAAEAQGPPPPDA